MRTVLFALLLSLAGASQARTYSQADLEALLAPLVAYPEEVAAHMLVAASYPDQVADAARGVPAQPHWHPSVAALLPYPDVLKRMAESPDWMRDVAWMHVTQQPQVLGTLQALRARHYDMPPPPMIASPPVIVQHHYYPAFALPRPHFHGHVHRHYRPVPESRRRPVVSSTPQVSRHREARRAPPVIHFKPDLKRKRR